MKENYPESLYQSLAYDEAASLILLENDQEVKISDETFFCCFSPKKKSVTASDSLPNLSCNFLTVSLCLTRKKVLL